MKKKRKDIFLWIGIGYLVALVVFAIIGPSIFKGTFDVVGSPHQGAGAPDALIGTDNIGRSFLPRLAYGARISLGVGLAVQFLSLIVGITVGVLGEFAPKWISVPLMRLTDGMFAFPDILLAILLIGVTRQSWVADGGSAGGGGLLAVLPDGLLPVIVALSITAWPTIARLTKTQIASLKDREFVVAARASGASVPYIVIKHLLPQMTGVLLAVSMIDLAGTILAESTLSFLGIGVQPPSPSWGSMINDARSNMNSYPIELLWPCLILSLTIFALNFVGDGLRNLADPKSK